MRQTYFRIMMRMLALIAMTLILNYSSWGQVKYKTLYQFTGGADGSGPMGGVVFDQAGNLYGTTAYGGNVGGWFCEPVGCGVAYKLAPGRKGKWTQSVLYTFCLDDCADQQSNPLAGLIIDQAGNLYGTSSGGYGYWAGTVFMLAPTAQGGSAESTLYGFCANGQWPCPDGLLPEDSLTFDQAGNIYGTTTAGGNYEGGCDGGCGVVFKLAPNSNGGWTDTTPYSFCSLPNCADGYAPSSGVTFDTAGNLYGTTPAGGASGQGIVFELTPNADGSWTQTVLYNFTGGKDGGSPSGNLIFDAAGNLYGSASTGGTYGGGTLFELSRKTNGVWRPKMLHEFTGGKDGSAPSWGVTFDKVGNLYGTANGGGAGGYGVVFKMTPTAKGGWNFQVLYAFTDNPGASPLSTLVFDASGNLYGTTYGDGSKTFGSVFEIIP